MLQQLLPALNPIEVGGLISGVVYVILAARENVWCWPVGLVNVILFIFLNFEAKLYADVGLQGVYLLLTVYGWYNWLKKTDDTGNHLPITRTSGTEWLVIAIFTIAATIILSVLLSRYTDTNVPRWDSFVTALSLAATWMVAVKKLENWLVWIFTDLLYIALYYYKNLYLLAVLFAVYVVIAVQGYFYWRKLYVAATHPRQ